MRLIGLLGVISTLAIAQTEPQVQSPQNAPSTIESIIDEIEENAPEVEVTEAPEDIVKSLPKELFKENNRYFTFSMENDFLVFDGIDQDYTNGVRLTYLNVGQDQPKLVRWLDDMMPAFEINKTTSTYYSVGQNLYTPHDILPNEYIENDRPYGAFLYGSIGLATVHEYVRDDIEITLGIVGPSAQGEFVQSEFHRMLNMDIPNGWGNQLHDEVGMMLSWERTFPRLYAMKVGDAFSASLSPHYGFTLGNVYTYGSFGLGLDITPQSMPWQMPPVRVRPAIPGSGMFVTPESGHTWQLFAGVDTRLVARNIFLDGNTFNGSHRISKRPFVLDAALGAAYTWKDLRMTYTYNWRSKEFYSPYSKTSQFGALSFTYRF